MLVVRCSLFIGCWLLFVVCCLLMCCSLFVGCCVLLFAVVDSLF